MREAQPNSQGREEWGQGVQRAPKLKFLQAAINQRRDNGGKGPSKGLEEIHIGRKQARRTGGKSREMRSGVENAASQYEGKQTVEDQVSNRVPERIPTRNTFLREEEAKPGRQDEQNQVAGG